MGGRYKSVNVVDAKFDAMYKEEVQFLANQLRVSRLTNPRPGENQVSTKKLEAQMGQISAHLNPRPKGGLPSDTVANIKNDNAQCIAILTRSRKVVRNETPNDEAASSSKGKAIVFESDELDKELNNEISDKVNDTLMVVEFTGVQNSNVGLTPLMVPTKSLPMSSTDFETINMSHYFSAIMSSNVVVKKDDPGAFTILCTIRLYQFAKELCDLGASINLMPYAIFKQLGLGEPNQTTMRLLMSDHSIKHSIDILYDILVKVDKFIFLADFVILYYEINTEVHIILGRPFLAISRALVDVESSDLKFQVNGEEVTFNVCKYMNQPNDLHLISVIDVIDKGVVSVHEISSIRESLAAVLLNFDKEEIPDYDEGVVVLSGIVSYPKNSVKLDIDLKNRDTPPTITSIDETLKLELKVLPYHI
ncbi:uncharacterized protein LOC129884255 [Solanum dulcamara]|uniref:uncharacterized protein LOC129884255 n=1 Tax=Solanum dulcamara TaxID=45834 RepID=UPI0024855B65|nr:uncharacterized protein LOC129884255 [Solanum dulcamara]